MRSVPRRVQWLIVSALPAAAAVASALFLPSRSLDAQPVAASPATRNSPVAVRQGISATVWTTEVITHGAGIAFVNDALHLDANDVPSLAFYRTGAGGEAPALYYAWREGMAWTIETITDDVEARLTTPSLGLDAQSEPHVSFAISGTVYYAQHTDGSWQIDVVDDVEGAGIGTALAVNMSGTVGIAYNSGGVSPQSVYYAEASGDVWTVTRVATGTQNAMHEYNTFSSALDAAFDGNGQPHIAFVSLTNAPRPYASLRHAARIGGSWQYRTVGGESYLDAHAMTMKNTANDFFAYRVFGPHCVIPCPMRARMVIGTLAVDTPWPDVLTEYIGYGGSLLSLDAYAGAPEFVFDFARAASGATASATRNELMRERLYENERRSDTIAIGNLTGAALAVTSQGQPLVVYYDADTQQLVMTKPEQLTFAHGLFLPGILLDFVTEEYPEKG